MDLDESAEKDYIVILDGYTDEHSIFGVPPYIAPLPRYVHGTLHELDTI